MVPVVAGYLHFADCIVVLVVRYLRILYSCRGWLRCWHWRHRRHHRFERTLVVAVAGTVAVAVVVRFVEDWEGYIERYEVEFVELYAKHYRSANFVLDLRHLLRRREEYVVPFQWIDCDGVRNLCIERTR